jgi:hypothetical protein
MKNKIIIPQEKPKQEQKQHLIDMMEDAEQLGLYDQSKQETLEEAAEKYANMHQDVSEELGIYLVKAVFQDGAKWKTERSYSEEEVHLILGSYSAHKVAFSHKYTYDMWFNQFKK